MDAEAINLDVSPNVGADVVWDLEKTPLPFDAGRFVHITARHVLEHIRNLVPLMADLHRILCPGGLLEIHCPYGSSDDAWEDPTHVRAFFKASWVYFNKDIYQNEKTHGYYDSGIDFKLEIEAMELIIYDEYKNKREEELQCLIQTQRNVVKEMRVILKKAPLAVR